MRKKIVIVDNSTWNIYNFRLSLIKKLKAEGYLVVVVAPVDKYIHYLNDSYFTKHIPLRHLFPQTRNVFKDFLFTWELYRIFKRERPDLVLNYTIKPNIFGSLAARMARVSAIATITGLGYTFLHQGGWNQLVPWLYRLAFQKVKKVVFYNSDDRNEFVDFQITSKEKSTIIPGSGVNTNHYRPLFKRGHDRDKFVFLFIGRLLYDKGLQEFVDAARRLKRISPFSEFWVIGELNSKYPNAVPEEKLLEWISAKQIRYFGEAQDVRKYIKQANVVVLPSYREGVPRSILEAMAMCKPIITADTAGCRETVQEGKNGKIVPVKDSEALAGAMLELFHAGEEELEKMGYYSRQKVLTTFDDKRISEQFFQMINQTLTVHTSDKKAPSLQAKH